MDQQRAQDSARVEQERIRSSQEKVDNTVLLQVWDVVNAKVCASMKPFNCYLICAFVQGQPKRYSFQVPNVGGKPILVFTKQFLESQQLWLPAETTSDPTAPAFQRYDRTFQDWISAPVEEHYQFSAGENSLDLRSLGVDDHPAFDLYRQTIPPTSATPSKGVNFCTHLALERSAIMRSGGAGVRYSQSSPQLGSGLTTPTYSPMPTPTAHEKAKGESRLSYMFSCFHERMSIMFTRGI